LCRVEKFVHARKKTFDVRLRCLVNLDHPRIRGNGRPGYALVDRRRKALQKHLTKPHLPSHLADGCNQAEKIRNPAKCRQLDTGGLDTRNKLQSADGDQHQTLVGQCIGQAVVRRLLRMHRRPRQAFVASANGPDGAVKTNEQPTIECIGDGNTLATPAQIGKTPVQFLP
jgi:hypothetical protein